LPEPTLTKVSVTIITPPTTADVKVSTVPVATEPWGRAAPAAGSNPIGLICFAVIGCAMYLRARRRE
jgi:hypothetical protein